MPYRNPVGLVYDSGDYAVALDRLVELSGLEGIRVPSRGMRAGEDGIAVSAFAHYID